MAEALAASRGPSNEMSDKDEASPPYSAVSVENSSKKKRPPFLNHFNARDLKTLFRCSVAFWCASLLVLIGPTLNTFGTAVCANIERCLPDIVFD